MVANVPVLTARVMRAAGVQIAEPDQVTTFRVGTSLSFQSSKMVQQIACPLLYMLIYLPWQGTKNKWVGPNRLQTARTPNDDERGIPSKCVPKLELDPAGLGSPVKSGH